MCDVYECLVYCECIHNLLPCLSQMYVVEISPALGKGLFGALNQLAITIGILGVEAFGIGDVLKYYHLSLLPLSDD